MPDQLNDDPLADRLAQERWTGLLRRRAAADALPIVGRAGRSSRHVFSLPMTGDLDAVTNGQATGLTAVLAGMMAALLHRYFGVREILGAPATTADGTIGFLAFDVVPHVALAKVLGDAAAGVETCLSEPGLAEPALNRFARQNQIELSRLIDFTVVVDGMGSVPASIAGAAAFALRVDPASGSAQLDVDGALPPAFAALLARQLTDFCVGLRAAARRTVGDVALLPEGCGGLAAIAAGAPAAPFDVLAAIARSCDQRAGDAAVTAGGETLTYADLAGMSDAVAQQLRAAGVGRGSIVAVLMNRDVRFPAAVLGVLKAGGAFLPLDLATPEARLQFILRDANVAALVTTARDSGLIGGISCPLVVVEARSSQEGATAVTERHDDDLAYVFYTSGSTGEPKGVMVEDAALGLLTSWLVDTFHAGSPRTLLTASFGFDASLQQLFAPLCAGGELVIAGDRDRRDPRRYVNLLGSSGARVIDITPAFLAKVLDQAARSGAALSVDTILVGGDAFPRTTARQARALLPQPALVNVFGITEAGCDSTFHFVRDDETDEAVPAGLPLPSVGITIENGAGEVMPRGIPGEICISGAGVARGYVGMERPDRFVERSGGRIFRTRDLGYIDGDGLLHALGRMDNEIKVQGYRIDLAGIANAIRRFRSGAEINPAGLAPPRPARRHCRECGLPDTHPGLTIDDDLICSVCHQYRNRQAVTDAYFGEGVAALGPLIERARAGSRTDYDCMLLYSGGKDSSYVLHRLVEAGYRVLAFTFDNDHISKAAFDNIARQTRELGVESHIARLDNMDRVFLESLYDDSTVCSGCFKALTATSTRLAADLGIGCVVTGLSRGQIAETKLARLLAAGVSSVDEIERQLKTMRRLYHSGSDATNALVGVDLADVDLSTIEFVDFFRYDPIDTPGVIAYLRDRDDNWAKPGDTGFCSSNCMINDTGICVHLNDRGFHNYAAPLAWDVRLGIIDDAAAGSELRTDFKLSRTNLILKRLGFFDPTIQDVAVVARDAPRGGKVVCAYFVADEVISFTELRNHLARLLPAYMIPTYFIPCKTIPLTVAGKLDVDALPSLDRAIGSDASYVAPTTVMQTLLIEIWQEVLGIDQIGIDDPFFSLGGKSLDLFEAQRLVEERAGVAVEIADMFALETVRGLADHLDPLTRAEPSLVSYDV